MTASPTFVCFSSATVVIGGAGSPSVAYFALAAIPARFALEHGEWKQAAQLVPQQSPFLHTIALTWFARGLGAARLGQTQAAEESASSLQQIHDRLQNSGENYWALQVQIAELEVRAWSAYAAGHHQAALRQLESAAQLEDGTEKSAVTPGPLAPARELLGEMLLLDNQPGLALDQFEATLGKEPNRFRSTYGAAQAAKLSNRPDRARKYYLQLAKVCEHSDRPGRPEIREVAEFLAQPQP